LGAAINDSIPSPKSEDKLREQKVIQQAFEEREAKELEFETVFVNKRGKIIETRQCEAYYYDQPLESEGDSIHSRIPPSKSSKGGKPKVENLRMIYIPEGEFWMGSPKGEKDRSDDESPQHLVKVLSFYMAQTPITQAQWRFVANLPQEGKELNPEPSYFKGDDNPVERVTWYDAIEFCARLSRYTGRDYRLPSEAEWEYACRAVTSRGNHRGIAPTLAEWNKEYNQPFHFGETITLDLANYSSTYIYQNEPQGKSRGETTPVCIFKPNAFGLYDMSGNVWEWCLDPWHRNYEGAPTNGSVWDEQNNNDNHYYNILENINILSKDGRSRVHRGGSWLNDAFRCRSAYRDSLIPDWDNSGYGFRVVRG
jgi:formylglycine-generating enzyme required for sulfatase activity